MVARRPETLVPTSNKNGAPPSKAAEGGCVSVMCFCFLLLRTVMTHLHSPFPLTFTALAENDVYETSAGVDVIPSFDQMGLKDKLLQGIYNYGLSAEISAPACLQPSTMNSHSHMAAGLYVCRLPEALRHPAARNHAHPEGP